MPVAGPFPASNHRRNLIQLPCNLLELAPKIKRPAMPCMADLVPALPHRGIAVGERIEQHALHLFARIRVRFMDYITLNLIKVRRRKNLAVEMRMLDIPIALHVDNEHAFVPLKHDVRLQPRQEHGSIAIHAAVNRLCPNAQLTMLSPEVLEHEVFEKRLKPPFSHISRQLQNGRKHPVLHVPGVALRLVENMLENDRISVDAIQGDVPLHPERAIALCRQLFIARKRHDP